MEQSCLYAASSSRDLRAAVWVFRHRSLRVSPPAQTRKDR
jgi:hypothetical protein